MLKNLNDAEPVAIRTAIVGLATWAAHTWAPADVPTEVINYAALILLGLLARAGVVSPATHAGVRRAAAAAASRSTGVAAAAACVLVGLAACTPPVPLDSAEQLRQARAAGADEVMGMARGCLGNAELATDREVLVCIFGAAAVAAAPDRSPSRGEQLRDQATDVVGGILGALGRRGAAEIEGR